MQQIFAWTFFQILVFPTKIPDSQLFELKTPIKACLVYKFSYSNSQRSFYGNPGDLGDFTCIFNDFFQRKTPNCQLFVLKIPNKAYFCPKFLEYSQSTAFSWKFSRFYLNLPESSIRLSIEKLPIVEWLYSKFPRRNVLSQSSRIQVTTCLFLEILWKISLGSENIWPLEKKLSRLQNTWR